MLYSLLSIQLTYLYVWLFRWISARPLSVERGTFQIDEGDGYVWTKNRPLDFGLLSVGIVLYAFRALLAFERRPFCLSAALLTVYILASWSPHRFEKLWSQRWWSFNTAKIEKKDFCIESDRAEWRASTQLSASVQKGIRTSPARDPAISSEPVFFRVQSADSGPRIKKLGGKCGDSLVSIPQRTHSLSRVRHCRYYENPPGFEIVIK